MASGGRESCARCGDKMIRDACTAMLPSIQIYMEKDVSALPLLSGGRAEDTLSYRAGLVRRFGLGSSLHLA